MMAQAGSPALVSLVLATALGVVLWQGRDIVEQVPEHMTPPPGHGPYTGTVADWPLWFPWHRFAAYCFSVQKCRINYGNIPSGTERPQPSVESFQRPLEQLLYAGNGPIRNFPPPAKVSWVALDGTPMTATVDIAEIFSDRMVRHTVAREDILEKSHIPYPGIILVVDNRSIRVYMSTWIALKESARRPDGRPGRIHSGLVMVHSEAY